MALVAHKDTGSHYPECIRGVFAMPCTSFYRYRMDTIIGLWCNNRDVTESLSAGRGVLVYRGHGTYHNWPLNWSYDHDDWEITDVNNLPSNGMPSVVLSVCCSNGRISEDDCLAEAWMRKSFGGGVACFAATEATYNPANHGVCSTLVRTLCDTAPGLKPGIGSAPAFDLGSLLMNVDGYLAKVWGERCYEDIWRYLMLGDPSMPVWVGGMPQTPAIACQDLGQSLRVQVTVNLRPVEGASVCAIKEPDVCVQGYTGTDGVADLRLRPHGAGLATVTVSEGHAAGPKPHTPILPGQASVSLCAVAWQELDSMPVRPSGRRVKDGGWLAFDAADSLMYGAKGNKRSDFYSYSPATGYWSDEVVQIPLGREAKPPYKGCSGVCDNAGHVYVTKGNNTLGFWRYSADSLTWTQLNDVPLGPYLKRVKGGTSMAFAQEGDTGWVYLLKGYRNEFYRFNSVSGAWDTTLPEAPAGWRPKWDRGSWLVYDGVGTIYAHKARYHELWTFDVATHAWVESLPGMPFVGVMGKKKKSKDGGSAAWFNSSIYAMKGGNTQECWRYRPLQNDWIETETIPCVGRSGQKKRVEEGGSAASDGHALYVLKGHNSVQFWRYCPDSIGISDGGWLSTRVVPPQGRQTDAESPFFEGVEASSPRWRPNGTAACWTHWDGVSEQVFWRQYVPLLPERQASFGDGDCYDPCFDMSGSWVYFCREESVGGCYTQVCRVAAAMVPPPVQQLTFGPYEAAHVEVSPDNQWCAYDRETEDGHTAIFRIPVGGGQEQQLTQSGPWDDETPVWLSSTELAFTRWPDNGEYEQLLKLDLQTMEVAVLTTGETDHEQPCASYSGNSVAYSALDPSGTAQVGLVSAGGGDEHFLTADPACDITEPDWSQDGVSIFASRSVGPGSEIGLVDALQGGFMPLTDASAIRESPDCFYHPDLTTNFVIYSREALGGADGFGVRPKFRRGTGIFLSISRRPQDGIQASSFIFGLEQARPNPAKNRVTINWQVPQQGPVQLKLYDASGRLTRTLVNQTARPGRYREVWSGTDDEGRSVAAGVYFMTLEQNGDKLGRKVVLAR